jgi:hypothetical protein
MLRPSARVATTRFRRAVDSREVVIAPAADPHGALIGCDGRRQIADGDVSGDRILLYPPHDIWSEARGRAGVGDPGGIADDRKCLRRSRLVQLHSGLDIARIRIDADELAGSVVDQP